MAMDSGLTPTATGADTARVTRLIGTTWCPGAWAVPSRVTYAQRPLGVMAIAIGPEPTWRMGASAFPVTRLMGVTVLATSSLKP